MGAASIFTDNTQVQVNKDGEGTFIRVYNAELYTNDVIAIYLNNVSLEALISAAIAALTKLAGPSLTPEKATPTATPEVNGETQEVQF